MQRPRSTRYPAAVGHRRGWVFHAAMVIVSLLWLSPLVFVALVALRSSDDLVARGIGAAPASLTLEGFSSAFTGGRVGQALINSALITAPAVLVSLLLASFAAYGLSRFRIPWRRTILLVMLSGNLLPPQILLIPVAHMSQTLGIYDTIVGVIAIHVGFGMGFYTFVLYGFMRAIPDEITDAAKVDGTGPLQTYSRIIMPLSRSALAALAALATTWIYNDLLWALTILRTSDKFPATVALLNLQGEYVSEWNVVAAGSLMMAVPTAIVFFSFQRQFMSGLIVGSTR